jgi:hypothetical protein
MFSVVCAKKFMTTLILKLHDFDIQNFAFCESVGVIALTKFIIVYTVI